MMAHYHKKCGGWLSNDNNVYINDEVMFLRAEDRKYHVLVKRHNCSDSTTSDTIKRRLKVM